METKDCPECGHPLPHNKLPDSHIIMMGGFKHECRVDRCPCTYGNKSGMEAYLERKKNEAGK